MGRTRRRVTMSFEALFCGTPLEYPIRGVVSAGRRGPQRAWSRAARPETLAAALVGRMDPRAPRLELSVRAREELDPDGLPSRFVFFGGRPTGFFSLEDVAIFAFSIRKVPRGALAAKSFSESGPLKKFGWWCAGVGSRFLTSVCPFRPTVRKAPRGFFGAAFWAAARYGAAFAD